MKMIKSVSFDYEILSRLNQIMIDNSEFNFSKVVNITLSEYFKMDYVDNQDINYKAIKRFMAKNEELKKEIEKWRKLASTYKKELFDHLATCDKK